MFSWDPAASVFGMFLMLVFMVLAALGFVLIAWALLKVSERSFEDRGSTLEDLRQRYARGEIDGEEFEAQRRRLLAR